MKATDAAQRSPTPTPIPRVVGACPDGFDDAVCALALELSAKRAADVPVELLSVTCPSADAWLIALEPSCTKELAGQRASGFSVGAHQFSLVDEAAFREQLAAAVSGRSVAGIACPRVLDGSSLDCGTTFAVLLQQEAGSTDGALILVRRSAEDGALFGVRTTLAAQPEVLARGGWINTAHAGLDRDMPDRMWLVPWQP